MPKGSAINIPFLERLVPFPFVSNAFSTTNRSFSLPTPKERPVGEGKAISEKKAKKKRKRKEKENASGKCLWEASSATSKQKE